MRGRLVHHWHIDGARCVDAHDGRREAGQAAPPLPHSSHEASRRPQGQGAQAGTQPGARRGVGGAKHDVGVAPRGYQRGAAADDHSFLAAAHDDALLAAADHDLVGHRMHPPGRQRRRRRRRQPGRPERRRRLPLGSSA
ncbi:MAG TPA: hypothetical protein VKR21_10090 [Solirubrobacteraceae bacterium]|nr:hypothetical protein [Solirubrobacteraceae bacterium]